MNRALLSTNNELAEFIPKMPGTPIITVTTNLHHHPFLEVIFGAGPVAPLLSALVTALLFILWGLGTAIPGGALRWFLASLGAVTTVTNPEMEGWNVFKLF